MNPNYHFDKTFERTPIGYMKRGVAMCTSTFDVECALDQVKMFFGRQVYVGVGHLSELNKLHHRCVC